MKAKILKFLRERDGFVSGQELCRELSVSRTAVWKAVSQLREEGYRIQAAQNRGYRLLEAPDVMTEAEITSRLCTRWAGRPVISLRETDSTNNEAKRQAEAGAPRHPHNGGAAERRKGPQRAQLGFPRRKRDLDEPDPEALLLPCQGLHAHPGGGAGGLRGDPQGRGP